MKNKIPAFLLSLIVALALWLYVATTVKPEMDQPFYNIPVALENERSLERQGLMLVSSDEAVVSVKLHGRRSELHKLDRSNIQVTVDLSTVSEPGTHTLNYKVSFPNGMESVSVAQRLTANVTVEIAEYAEKSVPVQILLQGTLEQGLMADTENASTSVQEVWVSGPKQTVDQIAFAGILVDQTDLTSDLSGDFVYTLMNEDGEPVDAASVTTDAEQIHLELPVDHTKEVKLKVDLKAGGGAAQNNARVDIVPDRITVSGSAEALKDLEEISLAEVDLGMVPLDVEGYRESLEIKLPAGLRNRSGQPKAQVVVRLNGLKETTLTLSSAQLRTVNVSSGLKADVVLKQIDVRFRGPAAEINALTVSNVLATLDLAGKQEGTYTVPLTITLQDANQNTMQTQAYQAPGETNYSALVVLEKVQNEAEET